MTNSNERKRLYTLLRVANTWCEQHLAGWTNDDYRHLLQRHGASAEGGKYSATSMTITQMEAAMQEFEQKGFKRQSKGKGNKAEYGWRAPRIAKLNAMWCEVHRLGIVNNRSESAMQTWCKKHVKGLQHLRWATSEQLNQAIEAMKQMIMQRQCAGGSNDRQ